jgi:hypothetical protein
MQQALSRSPPWSACDAAVHPHSCDIHSCDIRGDRPRRRAESYPDYSFRVSLPADPQIETTTYQITDDRAVEARVYAVPQGRRVQGHGCGTCRSGARGNGVDRPRDQDAVGSGEVKVNIPHRINRVFGRQLGILQGDDSRAAVALFDYNGRLYQIEGKSISTGNDATADAIRFVQSLIFTGGGSNRSADDIRAGRGACSAAGPGGAGSGVAASGASIPPDSAGPSRFSQLRGAIEQTAN